MMEFVNGKDDIPYMMENNRAMFETTQITAGVTHAAGFQRIPKGSILCFPTSQQLREKRLLILSESHAGLNAIVLPYGIWPWEIWGFWGMTMEYRCIFSKIDVLNPHRWYTYPPETWWSESEIGSSTQLLGKIKYVPSHQPL